MNSYVGLTLNCRSLLQYDQNRNILDQNGDGSVKNDCERNAAKRFIENFKREHPHLKVVILGDGITSNAPYIRLLESYKMKYILGAKPGDHQSLFDAVDASEEPKIGLISRDDILF